MLTLWPTIMHEAHRCTSYIVPRHPLNMTVFVVVPNNDPKRDDGDLRYYQGSTDVAIRVAIFRVHTRVTLSEVCTAPGQPLCRRWNAR